MFFRRRFYKGNRNFGRRRGFFRKSFGSRHRRTTRVLVPRPRGVMERKEVVVPIAGATLTYTTASYMNSLINGIDQGVTVNTRVGLKVIIRAVYIRGEVILNAGSAAQYRIMLVLDKQPNGGTFNINGGLPRLLNAITNDPTSSYAQLDPTGKDRFVVLASMEDTLNPSFANASEKRHIERFVRMGMPFQSIYLGAGATITSLSSNALFLAGVSDVVVGSAPVFYGEIKCIFTDD